VKLKYEAIDSQGKSVSDTVEAADAAEAIEQLRGKGLFVTTIAAATAAGSSGDGGSSRSGGLWGGRAGGRLSGTKRLKNLAMFTRQLSVLVTSGTPLVQALGSLERQAKEKAWRDVLAALRAKVEEGATLSESMAQQPAVFDPVCRSLIAAGESGGSFDAMLERLAQMTRKQMQVRSAVIGAMVYPCLLIVIAIGVLALMLLFVLPRFMGLFEQLDAELPPTTKVLVVISNALRSYWWLIPIVLGGAFFGIRTWLNTATGRSALDALVLRLPMAGPIVRSFAVARITRVLGVLMAGRVPMLEALALARQTAKNVRYVALVARAEEAVTRGSTISAAFAEAEDLVSPSICEAIRSGEQSGQMGPLLLNIADFLDEDNEVVVKSLTSILEPLILIALGLVVGFVALSMFMPLFDLTSATHGK
jgi:type II secretory pathway component PulF